MTTLDLARLRDIRRVTNFAYVIKVEVVHKSKSALAGGNSVNSCNNVVHNRKNCALRIRAVVIGKWGARILTHISRIDARGVEVEFQATSLTDAKDVKSVVEKFREKYGAKE